MPAETDEAQAPPAPAPVPAVLLQEPPVEVRILGQIEIRGVPKIDRGKSVELVAYLALHPQGVDAERLWEALWPEKPLNRGTLQTTVSVARSRLGRDPEDELYLPDLRDGLYRVSPVLGLDWRRFQQLADHGQRLGAQGADALQEALELVRGGPLESAAPRSYEWAVVHRTEIETVIGEVAERLAQLRLEAGDHAEARWAARRGLLAAPYDERLYRMLMRAAGNPAGVDTVLDELLRVIGDGDGEPLDELHPQTVALYRQLRGSKRPITT